MKNFARSESGNGDGQKIGCARSSTNNPPTAPSDGVLNMQPNGASEIAEIEARTGESRDFAADTKGARLASHAGMLRPYDDIERVANQVIGCAIEVHRILGPGLLESVYTECLLRELRGRGLLAERDLRVPIIYKGERLGEMLKIDVLVEKCVIVELKAVEKLAPVHEAQVITYLKLSGCPAGLLMNFNSVLLRNGLRRLDHPERYQAKRKKEE
jgi:GxxExxY protein